MFDTLVEEVAQPLPDFGATLAMDGKASARYGRANLNIPLMRSIPIADGTTMESGRSMSAAEPTRMARNGRPSKNGLANAKPAAGRLPAQSAVLAWPPASMAPRSGGMGYSAKASFPLSHDLLTTLLVYA